MIGRPVQIGHAGEFIAATIFGIQLHPSASYGSSDGFFLRVPLTGHSVDIKWYLKHEGILDLNHNTLPDYYLVLAGSKSAAGSSRGAVRPWVIELAFLFDAHQLLAAMRPRGIKLGVTTSVASEFWARAEIYPVQRNKMLILNDKQRGHMSRCQKASWQWNSCVCHSIYQSL